MSLKELVTKYRGSIFERDVAFSNKFRLNEQVHSFTREYRNAPNPMTPEQITEIVEKDLDYLGAKAEYAEAVVSYKKTVKDLDDMLQKIKDTPYDIIDEDVKFRGRWWNTYYRGFEGVPCPTCKVTGTFKDGKCTKDDTDQYLDDKEKECAASNFTHGLPAPVPVSAPIGAGVGRIIKHELSRDVMPIIPLYVSREVYLSGYSGGYMGAHVLCPGCTGRGSYRDGKCIVCKIPQYPPGTTTEIVLKTRSDALDNESQVKCYKGILKTPCPSCGGIETFYLNKCVTCGFGQYQAVSIKMRICKLFNKLCNS